ncbi:hypothetical protein TNIN_449561 [Trichonephila inaurata madagascariensis]|uniref:Uncharacterized protein n=1 Tax=Trichonephila inaurata madagascariensis TaxID=2747483 RepID=A0A8X6I5X3_9ARAC|nr:hypothetical protein TNIN_449561 [Trichonephila inaurata madagascariensis]
MDDSNVELTEVGNTTKIVWEKLLLVYEQSFDQWIVHLTEKYCFQLEELEDDVAIRIVKLQRNFSELNDKLKHVAKTTL